MPNKQEIIKPAREFYYRTKQWLSRFNHWNVLGLCISAVILSVIGFYGIFFSSPAEFPKDTVIRISKGSSISQVSSTLTDKKLIRSKPVFKALAVMSESGTIVAGDYKFPRRANAFSIARRLTRGEYGIDPIKVTVHEGLNSREIAKLLEKRVPVFDKVSFLKLVEDKEGKLFPDTYFIKPSDDEGDIVAMMLNNFEQHIKDFEVDIRQSGRSATEILTMASIIEGEARSYETRRMVSGILWNRVEEDMKLQVDVVFPYIMDKYSLQLTVDDLMIDSPYNTYRYKGLPPGPISNPGVDAIKAALDPAKTSYFYYLSDRNGEMHYAPNYKSHMANRDKYLGSR